MIGRSALCIQHDSDHRQEIKSKDTSVSLTVASSGRILGNASLSISAAVTAFHSISARSVHGPI